MIPQSFFGTRKLVSMKKSVLLLFICCFSFSVFSQITFSEDTWEPIGNTELRLRYDDADNGDGLSDGAISVDGKDTIGPLGALYTFQGTMQNGVNYSVQTVVYNYKSSFVRYYVELYNLTDQELLVSSPLIFISGQDTTPKNTTVNYTAMPSDDGDILQLRYMRQNTSSSNQTYRDFAIDNASLNGNPISGFDRVFLPRPIIDIPLQTPTSKQLDEMNQILTDMSDWMLGTTAPTNTEIANAISDYNALNIVTVGNSIDGTLPPPIDARTWATSDFLKTFAQHLKYNPNDITVYSNGLTMQEMVENTTWLYCYKYSLGELPIDRINYSFKVFAASVVFLKPYLTSKTQNFFYFALYRHSDLLMYYWSPTYNTGQRFTGAINIDDIGNVSNIKLAYALMQDTPEEKLQWTLGFKRYYERFMSYTPSTTSGIKSDGTSFHHQSGLNNYTYNYDTPMKILSILEGSSFQVSIDAYKVFRKGVYTQLFLANDNVEPLSMSGRHPEDRHIAIARGKNRYLVRQFAITGGNILGLSTPDPLIANAYYRHWGAHPDIPEARDENLSGFKPLNYHTSGIYWQNDWMAVARGQSNWSFGAETIRGEQHYGRYQSYGTLEIIYKGGQEDGNGYRWNGWNWNYNPGATSIVLPWSLLRVENEFQREYQKKGFVGSLSLNNINHEIYTESMGEVGVFAMDFAETDYNYTYGNGWSFPNTHNPTFVFKKSVFFFKDFIVSLGSNINNDDVTHPTVTTLFQRLSDTRADVVVDGTTYNSFGATNFSGTDNWVIDNFSTGYYVVNEGNNELNIQRENQRVPFWFQFDYNLASSNPPADYTIGYIDHGTNPIDAGYEFVVKPNISVANMASFANDMATSSTKPYTVFQKDENAHIVKDLDNNITAYALFESNITLPTDLLVRSNDTPCLIMYQETDINSLTFSIANPNMGFFANSFHFPHNYDSSVVVPIQITLKNVWSINSSRQDVRIVNSTDTTTTLQFNTYDGKPIEVVLSSNPLGVKDIKSQFSIYPNPANSQIYINSNLAITKIDLFDLNGRKIEITLTNNSINISQLSSGIYLLRILTKKGAVISEIVVI